MASPMPTSLSTILTAIKSQIVTLLPKYVNLQFSPVQGLLTNPNLVRVISRTQLPPRLQNDVDILLRPGDITWNQGTDIAAGRICPLITRPLMVTVRSRLNVDMSDSDDSRLLDPQLGLIPLEEAVADILLDFLPTDNSSNWLTQEPLHPIPWPAEEKQEGEVGDWIDSRMAFQLIYQLALTQTGSGY